MNSNIYEAVRLKGKVTKLSAFEKSIIDLTLEAVSEQEIDNNVNSKHPLPPPIRTIKTGGIISEREYRNRAFTVGLVIGAAIVGIVLTAIFL